MDKLTISDFFIEMLYLNIMPYSSGNQMNIVIRKAKKLLCLELTYWLSENDYM